MASKYILSSLLLLIMVTDVRTQFFDIFGWEEPISQTYQPNRSPFKHFNDHTTKRPKVTHTRPDRVETTKKSMAISVTVHQIARNVSRPAKKRKQTTIAPLFNFFFTTTKAPKTTRRSTTISSQKPVSRISTEKSRPHDESHYVLDSDGTRNWYEKPIASNLADYYTAEPFEVTTKSYNYGTTSRFYNNYDRPAASNVQTAADIYSTNFDRPTYNNNNRPTNNNNNRPTYNNNNRPTNNNNNRPTNNNNNRPTNNNNNRPTNNNHDRPSTNYNSQAPKLPFYNRPGVKPAVIDNRPPITNRPVTKKPVTTRPYVVNSRPTDISAIAFPNEDISPEIISGVDEDTLSEADKRRYIEVAERMCDKYKSSNTKQLQAIPLVPSPDPVRVNVSTCTPPNVPLVIGGEVVSINDYPHMALLGWVKLEGGGYSWKCGGSLISDQFVLTAAHCAYQERDNTVITGPPRVVQLGSSYLDDPGALVVRVSAVIRHPKYKQPKSYYDLALVKLLHPVTFSEVIKPACLGVPPPPGRPVIVTGWGRTEFGDEQSLELRSVSVPVWDTSECYTALGTSRKLPDGPTADSQICAGERQGGKDTCQGDSGGPAQIQDGCLWRVVAVTSFGRLCGAPNTPGVYAKVHRAFIASHVFGGLKNNNRVNKRTNDNNYSTNTQRNNQESHSNYRTEPNNQRQKVYSNGDQRQTDYNNDNQRKTDYNNDNQRKTDYNNDNQRKTDYNTDNQQRSSYTNNQQQTGYSNNQPQISYNNNQQQSYNNNNQRQSGNRDRQQDNYYGNTQSSRPQNYGRPRANNQGYFNNGRNWWSY